LCKAIAGTKLYEIANDYKKIGDKVFWEIAKNNRVESIVGHTLINALGRDNVPTHWVKAHDENSNRISAYLAELDYIADKLTDKDIPLIVLKNGGIARGIYPCPGCCPMGDLDVLVEKKYFQRAHQVLLNHDYHFEFRSPLEEPDIKEAEENGGAEYWKILTNGDKLWFELQWRAVAGRWIRPEQEPSTKDLVRRSISISGTTVRILSPEDNLLQVSLHTAKHSYVRAPGMRLHTDVDRIVRHQSIDWNVFLKYVLDLQVKTAVYFSLIIPKALFDTPIPDEVLARLKLPAWKVKLISGWLKKAGLFNPDERKFGKLRYILFNVLLYDDLNGLWKAVFPEKKWMKERYGFKNNLLLPAYYIGRLKDLLFRRIS
jgi:hypothetical protein